MIAMKSRAPYRSEVKTRLTDEAYAEFQLYKEANGYHSEAAALSTIVEKFLLGANHPLRSIVRRESDKP
ncbi:hypothetical protein DFLDMN_001514 [Cupriavidus sp. H19C3]|uniref:hypothetical protein n=1 Tax=Cupriavidus sp. H19C3 TaxID=3241603 RepID=UPI003BF8319E